jgi:hypothetical protein
LIEPFSNSQFSKSSQSTYSRSNWLLPIAPAVMQWVLHPVGTATATRPSGAPVGNDQIIDELARSRYGGCLLCCETARKAEHSGAKAAADGLSVFG